MNDKNIKHPVLVDDLKYIYANKPLRHRFQKIICVYKHKYQHIHAYIDILIRQMEQSYD